MQSQEVVPNNEQNLLAQLRSRYLPYWPLFLALMIICVGAAWVYLKFTVPLYESKASILINDERRGMDDSKMIQSLNLISTKKIVSSKYPCFCRKAIGNCISWT